MTTATLDFDQLNISEMAASVPVTPVSDAAPAGAIVPVAATSGMAQGALALAVEPGNVSCWFQCGVVGASSTLTNIATRVHPRYACHPCNNARVALERQLRKSPQMSDWLKELKFSDPNRWKKYVRGCRVCPRDNPTDRIGVSSVGARQCKMVELVQTVSQFVMVQERVSVVWLQKLQFLAHMKYIEGLDDSAALARWESDLQSQCVQKRGSGDALEMAVAEPLRTEALRGKSVSTRMSVVKPVTNEDELRKANDSLRLTSLNANITDADFDDAGAHVFRSGAASSSRQEEGPLTFATPASVEAPPVSLRAAPSDFPWASLSTRTLHDVPSDPQQPKPLPDANDAALVCPGRQARNTCINLLCLCVGFDMRYHIHIWIHIIFTLG